MYRVSWLFLSSLLLCSCGASRPLAPQIEIEQPQYQVEVTTSEQEALDEIDRMPTEFAIDMGEQRAAWERALYFFSQYAEHEKPVREHNNGKVTVLSNREDRGAKYHYEIQRAPADDGYTYKVICIANASSASRMGAQAQAQRNARNLARFIKEGSLEASLLTQ